MSQGTRRGFLQTAGAAVAVPGKAAAAPAKASPKTGEYRHSGFAPASAPKRISENLWLFEDTCNVYVVRDGTSCTLIDFGSGEILDHLKEMGISKVEWILHTHHHREQCQGDHLAVDRKIPIACPAHERNLFADAENFWRNRRIFHLYYMRNDFNTVAKNIPVEKCLFDYSTFRSGKRDFFVLPAPGHTLGSVALIADVDGHKVAFTGDLMHSPGKIQTLYDTQVNYGGSEGVDFGIYSLAQLREQKPQMICPSHGDPLPDPDAGMAETMRRLIEYYRFEQPGEPMITFRPYTISPHLIGHHLTTASFYAILSDSGKAMFIDYGSASNPHFGAFERATALRDRIRFVEHSIGELRRSHGMKSIDVAMPTHMHDDHMNGFPHLIRRYGTKVWCYENMQEIFEKPRTYNLGCTLAEPFKVNRTFRHGEKFKWEEYEFEIAHSPGHTEYQMALYVTIDGTRTAFTGDAFFANPKNDGTLRHNLIFRNHVESDSHLKSIRGLIEHEPQTICPGHGKAYPVDRSIMLATEQKMRRQQELFSEVLPDGEVGFGLDPSWVKIVPYQILLPPGTKQELQIQVQNYRPSEMKLEVALIAPAEWRVEPDVVKLSVAGGAHGMAKVTVGVPSSWTPPLPRIAITADVVRDGRYLGQVTEAVVDFA